jgi:hypothetical protein
VCLRGDQAIADCQHDSLDAVLGVEPLHRLQGVLLDGSFRQAQHPGDSGRGQSLRHQVQDFSLSLGQVRRRWRRRAIISLQMVLASKADGLDDDAELFQLGTSFA